MDFNKIIARVKAILLSPNAEWPVIAAEQANTGSVYSGYVVPLAVLQGIATFLKLSVFGVGVFFLGTYRASLGSGLTSGVMTVLSSLLGVFILALIVDALAPTFGGTKDKLQSLKTAAYAGTAAMVGGILSFVPAIGYLLALVGGIYSIYLLYLALPHTMKAPRDKTVGYTVVVVLCAIVLGVILSAVTTAIVGRSAMSGLGGGGLFGSAPTTSSSGGSFEGGSLGGALQGIAEAGKKMEAAEKSGDANAQLAAAGNVLSAIAGGGAAQVEALPVDRIKSFLPESLGGLKRAGGVEASRNGALGMQISEARASYGEGDRQVRLEVTDMGSARGLMGLAAWANIEEEKETGDGGFEKTYKQGENVIHEEWHPQSKNGEYSVMVAQRFMVKVEGDAGSMDQLKSLMGGVNLAGLAALRNEGVKAAN